MAEGAVTPLEVWQAKVRQAVERFEEKQKSGEGTAANNDARLRGRPGVTSDEVRRVQEHCTPDPDR